MSSQEQPGTAYRKQPWATGSSWNTFVVARAAAAGLDGGVVGNHDAADAGHMADHKRAAATGTPAMFRVHAVAGQAANFQAGRVVVEKQVEPLLGGELALGVLFGDPFGTAPLASCSAW